MSKSVWIVLILVLVIIGGIFIFNGKDTTKKDSTGIIDDVAEIVKEKNELTDSKNLPSQDSSAKTHQIDIEGFSFSKNNLVVNTGDTVTWTNKETAHTVESKDGVSFESDRLENGDSYSFKFTKAGTYDYFCGIHPSMKATVTVL